MSTHERSTATDSSRLVGVSRVAAECSVSNATVRRWIREGLMPHVRLASGAIRVRRESLERFIDDERSSP